MSIVALITNQINKVIVASGIRVNAHYSINEEGRAAFHVEGKINVIVFIYVVRSDLFEDLQIGVRLRYISCTPADIFYFQTDNHGFAFNG